MSNTRQVMQQALRALEKAQVRADMYAVDNAIDALRAALAEPEQEPVAWRTFDGEGGWDYRTYEDNQDYAAKWAKRNPLYVGWVEPLYTAPTPRKPLTVFEIDAIAEHLDKTTIGWATHEFAAAIEKAHGIGEQHE